MSRDRNVVKQFFKSMSSELSGVEFFGYLGNREGVVKADNLNNVWVLLFNGSVVKARNKVAPLVSRTPVAVGYTKEDPKLLQILRVMNVYDRNTQPYLPPHAKSHSWPGADTVPVRAEQIVPGLALPSGGMVVKYYGWPYEIDGAWYYIRSREFDLTSYIPDTGAVWVSVEVDDAGDVTYVESDPADSKDLLTFSMLPTTPETRVMLFAVKCYTGQTEVVKTELDNDIFDPRLALHARKAAAVWGEITGDIEDQTDLVEYIDDRMTGLWDDRGNYDASGNAYPSSGGSGTAGAILKGDIWTISVAGTLPTGRVVEVGDTVRALVDSPGSTEANWAIGQNNIGYVAENSANKTDTMAGNTSSSTKYLSAKGVYDWAVATFQAALGYTAENSANKTDTMAGNTASSTKYLSAKGVYDWAVATFQAISTALSQIAGLTPSDDDVLQRKSGAWTNRTLAQLFSDFISGSLTRERLTANRTYYVRTDGSDSNNGLSNTSGGAFLTVQKAIDTISANLDINGKTVTVQIADGTYTTAIVLKNVVGFTAPGQLVIQGNNSTPSNVVISTTSSNAISKDGHGSVWDIKDLKITTTTSGHGLYADNGSVIRFGNLNFGSLGGSSVHIIGRRGGVVQCLSNYAVSGNAYIHFWGDYLGIVNCAGFTITFSKSPVFTYFAVFTGGGLVITYSMTFTNGNTVTGQRHLGYLNGMTQTNGTEATYYPGNVAGARTTGAQWV